MVYGTGAQNGQLLGCANIEPLLVAEEEIDISTGGDTRSGGTYIGE